MPYITQKDRKKLEKPFAQNFWHAIAKYNLSELTLVISIILSPK